MKNRILKIALLIPAIAASSSTAIAQKSKKVQVIELQRTLPFTSQKVWQHLAEDYGNIANFFPALHASQYQSGSIQGGIGAQRTCTFDAKGKKVNGEKISSWDPENLTFTNRMVTSTMPLDVENTQAIYRIEDHGNGTSTLHLHMEFRTKPAMMGMMAKGPFKKQLKRMLVGLEHHITTGEKVNATTGNFRKIEKLYSKQ